MGDLALGFVRANADLLGIDTTQLGNIRAVEVNPQLWQVNIAQSYEGIPVRYGRLAASINNGNLVVIGTETWGHVRGLDRKPKIDSAQALAAGFDYAGGASAMDEMIRQPGPRDHPGGAEGAPEGGGVRRPGRRRLQASSGVDLRLPASASRRDLRLLPGFGDASGQRQREQHAPRAER